MGSCEKHAAAISRACRNPLRPEEEEGTARGRGSSELVVLQ